MRHSRIVMTMHMLYTGHFTAHGVQGVQGITVLPSFFAYGTLPYYSVHLYTVPYCDDDEYALYGSFHCARCARCARYHGHRVIPFFFAYGNSPVQLRCRTVACSMLLGIVPISFFALWKTLLHLFRILFALVLYGCSFVPYLYIYYSSKKCYLFIL